MMVDMVPAGELATRRTLAASTPWEAVLEAYLDGATDSPSTRRAYGRAVRDALTALEVTTLAELTGAELARYRAAVTASTSHAPASQALALAGLRSFLKWAGIMGAHGMSADVVTLALRTPTSRVRKPYNVLAETEVGAILRAADNDRDRALLAIMLGAGLRVSEVTGLDVSDLLEDSEGGAALYVRHGKGRKDRTVPVQPEVGALVRRYLASTRRRLGDTGPMFRAHDRAAAKLARGRLTARAAGDVVRRTAHRAGIDAKAVSPHALRHTFAIRALRNGADIVAVAKLLGHASVVTTQRYLDHLETAELRTAIPHLPSMEAA
jgi:site-specific recombinase XerD